MVDRDAIAKRGYSLLEEQNELIKEDLIKVLIFDDNNWRERVWAALLVTGHNGNETEGLALLCNTPLVLMGGPRDPNGVVIPIVKNEHNTWQCSADNAIDYFNKLGQAPIDYYHGHIKIEK